MFVTNSFDVNNQIIHLYLNTCCSNYYYYFHNIDVAIISKFAQFEFKYGDIERGRTMFESLLSSYPRRVDLWCVYLNMMIQTNDITTVRLVQMNYY